MSTLTPNEDLFLEALTARHRCGEQIWTFDRCPRRTADQFTADGLVGWKYGIVENTILVWLTETRPGGGRSQPPSAPFTATGTEVTPRHDRSPKGPRARRSRQRSHLRHRCRPPVTRQRRSLPTAGDFWTA